MNLKTVVARLDRVYGETEAPPSTDPFELVMWENVAYLVDDARRRAAFVQLRAAVGITPTAISGASDDALYAVAKLGGMHPERRVDTWRACATIALELGDLGLVARKSLKDALRAFQKFPSLGQPGAEKVLLFCGAHRVLPVDSNGLRVLVRLGIGQESKSYSTTYRSVREALGTLTQDTSGLIHAHVQLRRHGQEMCRRTSPACEACPLRTDCGYYRAHTPT